MKRLTELQDFNPTSCQVVLAWQPLPGGPAAHDPIVIPRSNGPLDAEAVRRAIKTRQELRDPPRLHLANGWLEHEAAGPPREPLASAQGLKFTVCLELREDILLRRRPHGDIIVVGRPSGEAPLRTFAHAAPCHSIGGWCAFAVRRTVSVWRSSTPQRLAPANWEWRL